MTTPPISPPLLPLAADFPSPDESRWRTLAEKALNGQPWERLTGRTADGIALKPLYRAPDAPAALPSARGAAQRDPYLPWDIRQSVRISDPQAANAEMLADLRGGASSVEFLIGGANGRGVRIDGPQALATALDGLMPELAPVALNATRLGTAPAQWLADWLRSHGEPAKVAPAFNFDPITPWLADGGLSAPFETLMTQAAQFTAAHRETFPRATFFAADGRGAHEAGASEAQELALMLASAVAQLRALEGQGVAPHFGAGLILTRLAAGPDVIVEIAKLRAARVLWARLMELIGADGPMKLQAVTSRRMLTRYDAWTNLLRATAAGFAAGAGGADVVTVLPMTTLLGEAGAQARRLARNTQIILQEECGLGRVADPAGGAWAVERLTQDLAETAWEIFRSIETQGGLAASLRAGWLQGEIAKVSATRADAIAKRKSPLTGLTDFPMLDEIQPDFTPFGEFESGAALLDPIPAAAWTNLGAPFEALRDRAKTSAPTVFFATLGALAQFSPRANFSRNLLATGGIAAHEPERVHETPDGLVAAFRASGLSVALICGDDATYAERAAATATALKAAGALWVALAGKPGEAEATMRAAGVDQFLFAGQHALDALATLHASLGVA